MSSYAAVEMAVVQWGEARKIIQHGKPMGQAIKTLEECTELLDAINKGDIEAAKDAIGDVWVTLVMIAAIVDVDLVKDCFYPAYEQIKNRTGFLTPEGVFVKTEKPHLVEAA